MSDDYKTGWDEGYNSAVKDFIDHNITDLMDSDIQELREIIIDFSDTRTYQNFKIREWFKNKITKLIDGV